MDASKGKGKDTAHPPPPSVEDDPSPAPSHHDLENDSHELDEAFFRTYVAFKRLREANLQVEQCEEDVEDDAQQNAQMTVESTADASSSTSSSTSSFAPPVYTPDHHAHVTSYQERVAGPLHQQLPAQQKHYCALCSASGSRRLAQEPPRVHQTTVPPVRSSSAPFSRRQERQVHCANNVRYPTECPMCASEFRADGGAVAPGHLDDAREACYLCCESRCRARHRDFHSFRSGVPGGHFRHGYGDDNGCAERTYLGGSGVAKEAGAFEEFGEVFSAVRKIDADISALKRVLEGLLLGRFEDRGSNRE